MLWASLHFPDLPLQLLLRACPDPAPLAVTTPGHRSQVLACNHHAAVLGIKAGMALSGAYALAPRLLARPRDEVSEARALAGVALWAGQFSPMVSLASPWTVLLEIGGCLRLFGGLEPILRQLRSGLTELGYDAVVSVAPTPTGALLLSRAGFELQITALETLPKPLSAVSIGLLNYSREALDALAQMGIRTLGELASLPRDGLARRFGQKLLDELDRALGRLPDPREPFIPPARYAATLALPAPVEEVESLLFGVKRLILELAGFLSARRAGVTCLQLDLHHHPASNTAVTLALSIPTRDPEHLLALLRERLATVELPDRVEAVTLTAKETAPLAPRNFSLFGDHESIKENRANLVERLRSRLGDDAVCGLRLFPDARPELAWRETVPGDPPMPYRGLPRPVWLLSKPRPLSAGTEGPWLEGPLRLLAGPERIETGWWDGNDAMRDYFVASNSRGARFWIFKQRREGTWLLHGIFA